MVPNHGTKYEGNVSRHHGGMRKDGLTDGWIYSPILLRCNNNEYFNILTVGVNQICDCNMNYVSVLYL